MGLVLIARLMTRGRALIGDVGVMFDTFCPRAGADGRMASRPADRSVLRRAVAGRGVATGPGVGSGAAAPRHAGGEANLVLPDLGTVEFQGINGRSLLMADWSSASSAWRSAW